jgi:hypothetical protein
MVCQNRGIWFDIPWLSANHVQTEMVQPHRQHGEEGATAPLQPQKAEEIWLVTKNTKTPQTFTHA